ncbi:MAG: hypothetical protein C0445_05925 [Polaromonas sp.]|nr:hypothetical protein [Polaromonas sp.]
MNPGAAAPNTPSADQAAGQLAALGVALAALRDQPQQVGAFAVLWRTGVPDALTLLPPRFTDVFHGLLDRLESSALFAEESCSFSHTDLLDSLQLWVDQATLKLG